MKANVSCILICNAAVRRTINIIKSQCIHRKRRQLHRTIAATCIYRFDMEKNVCNADRRGEAAAQATLTDVYGKTVN